MALGKKITNINGSVTNYHRIFGISYDIIHDRAVLQIAHYANKDLREKEKEIKQIGEEISQYYDLLENFNLTPEQRITYQAKVDKLDNILSTQPQGTCYIDITKIELEGVKELKTIDSIYERLKQLKDYSGAKEV